MQKQNVLQQGSKQKPPWTLCFPAKEGNAVNPVHSEGTGNNSIGQSHIQPPPDPTPRLPQGVFIDQTSFLTQIQMQLLRVRIHHCPTEKF